MLASEFEHNCVSLIDRKCAGAKSKTRIVNCPGGSRSCKGNKNKQNRQCKISHVFVFYSLRLIRLSKGLNAIIQHFRKKIVFGPHLWLVETESMLGQQVIFSDGTYSCISFRVFNTNQSTHFPGSCFQEFKKIQS